MRESPIPRLDVDVTHPATPAPFVPLEGLTDIAPPEVRDALPLGGWRMDALRRLRLPVRETPVAGLTWLLDLPVWQAYGRHFAVTPRQVMAAPDVLAHQHERAMAADLEYPIHLCPWRGRTVILDGFHRLFKAVVTGRETLLAMMLDEGDFIAIGGADAVP